MRAHLDLVDAQLEQARRVLGDEAAHQVLPRGDDGLDGGAGEGPQDVHHQVRRGARRDARVEHRELQLVERLLHGRLGDHGVLEASAVRDAAHKDALLHLLLVALGAEQHEGVARDRGQALRRPVVQTLELEQVVLGREEVAALLVLRVAVGHRERELTRPLGRVGHHERDKTDALGLEGGLVRGEGGLDGCDQLLLGVRAVGDRAREGNVERVVRFRPLAGVLLDQVAHLRLHHLEIRHVSEHAVALGEGGVALRLVGGLVLELDGGGAGLGAGSHRDDVEGAVPALERHLHGRQANLGVPEESEERVGHDGARDSSLFHARLELGLELAHGLVERLLGLHQAKLGRIQGDFLVFGAGHLREGHDHVERWRQGAQRLDTEALREARELAQHRDHEEIAPLELLVRKGHRVHLLEVLGVGLDERAHRLVGRHVDERALDVDVAREEGARDVDGVLAQSLGVLINLRRHGRDGDAHVGLLRLEERLDELLHDGAQLGHEGGGLGRVHAVHVLGERGGVHLLHHRVELHRHLLAESGRSVLNLLDGQVDRRERREHRLHRRLGVEHVTVHDELERLLRLAEALERGGARDHLLAGRVLESPAERADLLDARRVCEREGGEQVALINNGARGLLVLDDAALGRLERDDHLHRLGLRERLTLLDSGAVLHGVPDELAGDVRAQLRRVIQGREQHGHAIEHHAQAESLLLGEDLMRLDAVGHVDGTVGLLAVAHLDRLRPDLQEHRVRRLGRHAERVLDVGVRDVDRDRLKLLEGQGRELALAEVVLEVGDAALDLLVGAEDGGVDHRRCGVNRDLD